MITLIVMKVRFQTLVCCCWSSWAVSIQHRRCTENLERNSSEKLADYIYLEPFAGPTLCNEAHNDILDFQTCLPRWAQGIRPRAGVFLQSARSAVLYWWVGVNHRNIIRLSSLPVLLKLASSDTIVVISKASNSLSSIKSSPKLYFLLDKLWTFDITTVRLVKSAVSPIYS